MIQPSDLLHAKNQPFSPEISPYFAHTWISNAQ